MTHTNSQFAKPMRVGLPLIPIYTNQNIVYWLIATYIPSVGLPYLSVILNDFVMVNSYTVTKLM